MFWAPSRVPRHFSVSSIGGSPERMRMFTPQRSRGGALNSTHLLATNRKLASGSSADLKVGATFLPPASWRRAKRQLRHAPLSTRLRGRTPKAPRAQAFAMASRPCSLTGKMPVPRRARRGHPFGKLRAGSGHVCGSGGDAPVTAGRMPHYLHPSAPSRVPRHVKDRSQESGVRIDARPGPNVLGPLAVPPTLLRIVYRRFVRGR